MKQKKLQTHLKKARKARRVVLTFPSMVQCSAVTGTPVGILQAAKDAGCDAFRSNSTVDFIGFNKWYYGQKGEVYDHKKEQARNLRLENERLEREAALDLKTTAKLEDIEAIVWEGCMLPVRQAIEAMPESVGPLANSERPDYAVKVLREWVETTKRLIRERATKQ